MFILSCWHLSQMWSAFRSKLCVSKRRCKRPGIWDSTHFLPALHLNLLKQVAQPEFGWQIGGMIHEIERDSTWLFHQPHWAKKEPKCVCFHKTSSFHQVTHGGAAARRKAVWYFLWGMACSHDRYLFSGLDLGTAQDQESSSQRPGTSDSLQLLAYKSWGVCQGPLESPQRQLCEETGLPSQNWSLGKEHPVLPVVGIEVPQRPWFLYTEPWERTELHGPVHITHSPGNGVPTCPEGQQPPKLTPQPRPGPCYTHRRIMPSTAMSVLTRCGQYLVLSHDASPEKNFSFRLSLLQIKESRQGESLPFVQLLLPL